MVVIILIIEAGLEVFIIMVLRKEWAD